MKANGYNVRLFEKGESLPFMQGSAINEIARSFRSRVVECGELEGPGIPDDGCGYLYVKLSRGGHESESIWIDNGSALACQSHNLGDGWQKTRREEGTK